MAVAGLGLNGMGPLVIGIDDPCAGDVRALLDQHLVFANEHTPPQDVHALDLNELLNPAVTLFSARRDRQLFAIGALKQLNETHVELKSMHTAEAARGQGIGQAMVDHLLGVARHRGYRRVSLETGAVDAFGPARSLYMRSGFTPCRPFGNYPESPNSAFMTLLFG
jgi:putative acetyltransferase